MATTTGSTSPAGTLTETTGRICLGLELDPAYVDVIVGRWAAFTGESPVEAASGRSFEDLKAARETEPA